MTKFGVSNRLDWTIKALSALGIPVERGYPSAKLRIPSVPVAAITVERTDLKETVLAIWICGTASLGGVVCEDVAQMVADALRQKRAFCQVGACQFDSKSNLFSVKVQALWKESLVNTVKVDRNALVSVTEFSAVQTRHVQQVADEETGTISVVNEEVVWTIAIQEQLPFQEVIEVEGKEAFTLTVIHDKYVEIYPECYWLSITLEENDGGLLRKRVARSWTERIIESDDLQT